MSWLKMVSFVAVCQMYQCISSFSHTYCIFHGINITSYLYFYASLISLKTLYIGFKLFPFSNKNTFMVCVPRWRYWIRMHYGFSLPLGKFCMLCMDYTKTCITWYWLTSLVWQSGHVRLLASNTSWL